MLRVIPFAIVGIGFLFLKLSEDTEKELKKLFWFGSMLMVPATFGSCIHIAVTASNSGLESLCSSLYWASGIIWTILLAIHMLNLVTGTTEKL